MEIHWYGLGELGVEVRADAEARLELLAAGHSDLIDARIAGRRSGHHRHGDQEIHITCQARGREIVVSRTCPDLGLALNEALDAFEREVQTWREKLRQRRRERPPEPPCLGIVDRIFRDRGYGFILTDAGEQVYFHRNAVKEGLDFDRLEETHRVALNVEMGREGMQATTVVAPPPGTPPV
ncbi:MAG: cold shock domain-containing protein [Myxococcota bacterium]|nr:cold shock domain-containing protein [Myxococcota bacterium]